MIFVTVGSQKFQFNRLLSEVKTLIDCQIVDKNEIFVQSGYCTKLLDSFAYEAFLDRDQFSSYIEQANLVITHGGTGSIITALKKNKKVIAVPRLKKFSEHVDDHQCQLLSVFKDKGYIEVFNEGESFVDCYQRCLSKNYNSFTSNNNRFVEDLGSYLYMITR